MPSPHRVAHLRRGAVALTPAILILDLTPAILNVALTPAVPNVALTPAILI
ncbi:hypothetical protein [Actinoplanes regularis]|uniref:hypothetical protein n=1 Tax=Actinoplanes regularis TaxID=52697 RepID=UPI0024A25300|nr:hypothetical protein [Actinoplanes regularis]GLW31896.1 hypothetical protein Areg01_48350 [Actinoplanes regularis]